MNENELISNENNIATAAASACYTPPLSEGGVIASVMRSISFSFDYNGIPAPITDWEQHLFSTDINAPGGVYTQVTRSFTAPDGFTAEMITKVYDGIAADCILYFENRGSADSGRVKNIQAFDITVTAGVAGTIDEHPHLENPEYKYGDESQPVLHLVQGNTGCVYPTLREMAPDNKILRSGDVFECEKISCSGSGYSPYFDLAWPGGGITFAIGWTGLWSAKLENHDGNIHITGGMKRSDFYLIPGERIRSSRTMYTIWQGEPETGYNNFRCEFIRFCSPRNSDGSLITGPIDSSNPDENATDGYRELDWLSHMEGIDVEVYRHDAWWHNGGFPSGMGNYSFPIETAVDKKRYPMGMAALGDAAHERGFKFSLWFAPETYPEGCTVMSEHPEYIISYPGKKGGIPDLLNSEAFDYFFSYFDECIKSWHIDVFRTDSGYDPGILWAHEPEGRTGIWEMKYVEALYRLWDKLRDENPGLVIDNCCGGGTRLDLELCSRSISVWRTDTSVWYGVGDSVRSPILGQTFSASFNRFIPYHQNATYDYDPYTMRSGFNGGVTFYMDIRRPDFDRNIANKGFNEVRRLRKFLTGDFYRLVFDSYNPYSWCAYQYHLPESNEGAVFIFRRDASPYPVCEIQLKAVYEGKKYEVDFYYGYDKNRTEYLSGSELKALTVKLSGAPASLLLEYRERPKYLRK